MRNYLIRYVFDIISLILLAILIGCGSETTPTEPIVAAKGAGVASDTQSFTSRLMALAPSQTWGTSDFPSLEPSDVMGQSWSIVARFTASTPSVNQRVFEYGGYNSPSGTGVSLEWDNLGHVVCATWADNNAATTVVSDAGAVPAGQEVTAICTFESGSMKLYLDGELVSVRTDTFFSDSGDFYGIGRSPYNGSTYNFQGAVDDLAVFSRVLSASEVQSLN